MRFLDYDGLALVLNKINNTYAKKDEIQVELNNFSNTVSDTIDTKITYNNVTYISSQVNNLYTELNGQITDVNYDINSKIEATNTMLYDVDSKVDNVYDSLVTKIENTESDISDEIDTKIENIPLAKSNKDGLLSKEDKSKIDTLPRTIYSNIDDYFNEMFKFMTKTEYDALGTKADDVLYFIREE